MMVGSTKSTQAQLSLPRSLFENFSVHGEETIRVLTDLSMLIECSKLAANSEAATTTLSYSVSAPSLSLVHF